MQGKFVFGGDGAKIPGTDFGISFALFKVWLCPVGKSFRGYTTGSNSGLLGAAIIETPVVDFVMTDLEDEEPFMDLHGQSVDVTISSGLFVVNGGTASIKLILKSNSGGGDKTLTFFSDECKGFSAAIGDIHFRATLLQLPESEWDATSFSFVPS